MNGVLPDTHRAPRLLISRIYESYAGIGRKYQSHVEYPQQNPHKWNLPGAKALCIFIQRVVFLVGGPILYLVCPVSRTLKGKKTSIRKLLRGRYLPQTIVSENPAYWGVSVPCTVVHTLLAPKQGQRDEKPWILASLGNFSGIEKKYRLLSMQIPSMYFQVVRIICPNAYSRPLLQTWHQTL